MEIKIIEKEERNRQNEFKSVSKFLFEHLDEYGDKLQSIQKCIDYAMSVESGKGGFVIAGYEDGEVVGAVIINKTGMSGYIPENILVYITVHSNFRGKGYGKKLMEYAINNAKGDIALHVEADNPAKHLYEKMGFTNPYLEMRLKK